MSKVYTSFQSLPDLRKSKNSVTNIILNNFSRFEDCKTKDDVIELCHELFDNANLDTAWTRQFFYNLSQLKNRDEAVLYVGNVYFKGAGLGMSRGKRVYEDDELNESMSDSDVAEFKKKLSAGEVKFKYMKKDGSERTAVGTLDPKLMNLPEKKTSSDIDNAAAKQKKARKLPADSVFYYDLEAKGFRSFKMSNFIEYV